MTNNASKSRKKYVSKFHSLGLEVDASEVGKAAPRLVGECGYKWLLASTEVSRTFGTRLDKDGLGVMLMHTRCCEGVEGQQLVYGMRTQVSLPLCFAP